MSTFGVDFGPKVDLTATIRSILRNYPEGTAILKELIQNADDAGATTISFCLDKRSHATGKLPSPSLASFQGPSLLVYNDAQFSRTDFESIQRIGDSLKKAEETQSKIGRFGIGFNSVYHITDLPSFISTQYVVMLDPQARFLPDVNPSNPGKMIDFVSNPSVIEKYSDQFSPFKAYNVDWRKSYDGTLFRLPIRTLEQASSSMLSKRSLSPGEVENLLDSLCRESSSMLLFLKNIQKIEVRVWTSHDEPNSTLKHSCSLSNISRELSSKRAFAGKALEFMRKSRRGMSVLATADYTLDILCESATSNSTYNETWRVCNQLGGGKSTEIAMDPSNELLRLVPWGGVASLVSTTNSTWQETSNGQAYCFLPLPVSTGLPVMVNAFFELSSNRRDIWQAGQDMQGDGRTRALWNISLLRDVISPSYVRLLLDLRSELNFSERFQQMWPPSTLSQPWQNVFEATLALCADKSLLKVCNGEEYLTEIRNQEVASKENSNNCSWISCKSAVLMPSENSFHFDDAGRRILINVLRKTNQPIVVCCESLWSTLVTSKACENIATPCFTRNCLRHNTQESTEMQYYPSVEYCRTLLSYCLSDNSMSNPKPSLELDALPLLPLANNSVGHIRVMTHQQERAVAEITGMGFSVTQAKAALSEVDFDVIRACDLLTSTDYPLSKNYDDSISPTVILVCDNGEMEVFSEASDMLLDSTKLNSRELEFLTHPVVQNLSNIKKFSPDFVPDLLRRVLPQSCFTGLPVDMSSLDESKVKSFLRRFWNFAKTHPDLITVIAEGVAIVPCRNGKILPLSRMSYCISCQRHNVKIPDGILAILETVGANVVDSSMLDLSIQGSFWDYVHPPGREGVLTLLESLMRAQIAGSDVFESIMPKERSELLTFVAESEAVNPPSAKELKVLRQLPIFCVAKDSSYISLVSSENSTQFCAMEDCSRLTAELFPSHFLRTMSSQVSSLYKKLGVLLISRSNYFKSYLLPNALDLYAEFPEAVAQDLFDMLANISGLLDDDKRFGDTLGKFSFVPNGSSGDPSSSTGLFKACELFDPTVLELTELLDSSFFPSEKFQREDILAHLRTLGLRTTLDWNGVLACAKTIDSMKPCTEDVLDSSRGEEASMTPRQKKGACLFQYLVKNIDRLMGNVAPTKKHSMFSLRGLFGSSSHETVDVGKIDKNLSILRSTAWIPVHCRALHRFMPWKCSTDEVVDVAPPLNCRPIDEAWYCSGSCYLSILPPQVDSFVKALSWNEAVGVTILATQLRDIALKYRQLKPATSSCTSNDGSIGDGDMPEEEIQEARETLSAVVPVLYQRLNSMCSQDVKSRDEVKRLLENCPWIWVGDNFVHPNCVAFTSSLSLSPYLYAIPQDLAVYKNLLNLFDIKQSFGARDFVSVLRQMAMETSNVETQSQTTPSDSFVDMSVSLVTLLGAEGEGGGFRPLDHTIYVPDQTGRLAVASDLVTDDVPWMTGVELASTRAGLRLCHASISSKVAEKVGVKSLRQILVDRSVESIFVDDSSSSAKSSVEAFGPSESLTSRLRTILDMYPDGNPIFSELIQNADDAGASIVRIAIDENSYPTESLMSPTVAAMQGPSVLFYNDATFSESDFRSLARIGQGTKLENLSTTGRFGLGFNSVYHLTDTPSFVSGEYLVVFDPHTTVMPGTTTAQPGLRMKYCGNASNLRDTFRDQFLPYKYFDCNFEQYYPGTLFRFPLRTEAMAKKAKLASDRVLLMKFSPLFKAFREICRVHSSSSQLGIYNDQKLFNYFYKTALPQESSNQISKSASDTSKPSKDEFYDLLGSTPDESLPTMIHRVEIATFSSFSDVVNGSQHFLVVTGIRGSGAKRLACNPAMRHLKLVPMGAVAACVRSDPDASNSSKSSEPGLLNVVRTEGQAFCFLPLPVRTQLPVHVNAYFELSSNRRDIWRGEDTTGESKIRSQWNTLLLRDVLAPLYAKLLCTISEFSNKAIMHSRTLCDAEGEGKNESNENSKECRLSRERKEASVSLDLLPTQQIPEPWNVLSASLLLCIKDAEVLWSNFGGGSFLPISKAVVMKECLIEYPEHIDGGEWGSISAALRLEQILLKESIPVAIVPTNTYQVLSAAQCSSEFKFLTSEFVRSVFQSMDADADSFSLSSRDLAFDNYVRLHPSLLVHYSHHDSSSDAESIIYNAVFLLEYCLSDYTNFTPARDGALHNSNLDSEDEYCSALWGLQLVPMENKTLGLIGNSTEVAPLYLASDNERKLLRSIGQCIVACDTTLGSRISSFFRSSLCQQHCNIRPLTPIDTLKLLRDVVPAQWFSSDSVLVNRFPVNTDGLFDENQSLVSVEWLQGLWGYIIESDCLSLFEGVLPIIPVQQPPCLPTGSYLLKVLSKVPVLHMSFLDQISDPESISALCDLGLHIIDPSPLGPVAYSNEISKILCDPTPSGLLSAICSVKDVIEKNSFSWSAARREAMHHLIFDSIIEKLDVISGDEKDVLRIFPVYKTCSSDNSSLSCQYSQLKILQIDGDDINPATTRCSLQIPPRSVKDMTVFDDNFVFLREPKDRDLYCRLGLTEPSGGEFYFRHVIPNIVDSSYSADMLSKLSVNILVSLSTLDKQQPGLSQALESCPFVRNGGGKYCQPNELFDPHASYLSSLLPPDAFPCMELYGDSDIGTILSSLRKIGLCTKLTRNGVLRAAKSIHQDSEELKASLTTENENDHAKRADYDHAQRKSRESEQRSSNLLRYLDLHIKELLLEQSDTAEGDDITYETNDEWCDQLRSIAWIAVYTDVPRELFINSIPPPWPEFLHSFPFAKPTQCSLSHNAWLCSASKRVSRVDIQSNLLRSVLCWNESSIPGSVVSQQLISIWQYYQKSTTSMKESQSSGRQREDELVETCSSVVSRLYKSLTRALEVESDVDVGIWLRALKSKPIIWISSAAIFVEPKRVAFSPLHGINAEPSLFVAKEDLLTCRPLMEKLGVKESFDLCDLVGLLRHFNSTFSQCILPADVLDTCVGIIKIISRILKGERKDDDINNNDIDAKEKNAEESMQNSFSSGELQRVGTVFVPDHKGLLADVTTLTYDDAPWISTQLFNRGGKGVQFVHQKITSDDAALLGAKSLREQLFAGDDIVCPSASSIQDIIENDTIADALGDLVGLSDMLGAHATHVLYDERCHPCESLMHPGLADCQGQALVVYMEGIVLDSEEITQLLISPSRMYHLPSTFSTGVAVPLNSKTYPDEDEALRKEIKFNTFGKRLTSAFAITDCLQILSGCQYFIFDPCGNYLLSPTDDAVESKSNAPNLRKESNKAQRCALTGENNEDLLSRFPDQFSPLLSLSFGFDTDDCNSFQKSCQVGQVNGTLIRMPLRTCSSPLSTNYIPDGELQSVMCHLLSDSVKWLEGSLVFSRFLQSVSLQHWFLKHQIDNSEGFDNTLVKEFYYLQCPNALSVQNVKRNVTKNKNWKKAGRMSVSNVLSSFFSQGINPLCEAISTVDIKHRRGILAEHSIGDNESACEFNQLWQSFDEKESHDENPAKSETESKWILMSLQGAPKARDLALKAPYKAFGLLPYVSVAAKVLTASEIEYFLSHSKQKLKRYFYCGGGLLSEQTSGLPYHVEGSYVMDLKRRGVLAAHSDHRQSLSIGLSSQSTQIMPTALIQQWNTSLFTACLDVLVPQVLLQLRDMLVATNEDTSSSRNLRSFYFYWPYLSVMSEDVRLVVKQQSQLLMKLSEEKLFLAKQGFDLLKNVILVSSSFSAETVSYLQSFMPAADVPSQISLDFGDCKIHFRPLTPTKLRDVLRDECHFHCTRLRNLHHVVLEMLKYCLTDILLGSSEDGSSTDYQQRRRYAMLKGSPLLITADGSIAPFPKDGNSGDFFVAPYALHALLPLQARKKLLHPTAYSDIAVMQEDFTFKDSLQIRDISASFIEDNINCFLPPSWSGCAAVEWDPLRHSSGTNRHLQAMPKDADGPSPLLVYILWREILGTASIADLEVLSRHPLLPVSVGADQGSQHLLVSAAFAPVLLNYNSIVSTKQEENLLNCSREAGRLKNLILRESELVANQSSPSRGLDAIERYIALVTAREESPSPNSEERSSIDNAANDIPENAGVSSPVDSTIPIDSLTDTLLETLHVLRFPFLDCSLLEGPPRAILENANRASFMSGGSNYLGHKLLHCVSKIHSTTTRISRVCDQGIVQEEFLLSFEKLNILQRKALLLEVLDAHRKRPLTSTEISSLKSLPIFTSREGNLFEALDERYPNIYWCESDAALTGLPPAGEAWNNDSDANYPVILYNDPELRSIYELIGAEELTPGLVVRKFTMASLGRMQGCQRLQVMQNLCKDWHNYDEDSELLDLLKSVAFIPTWMTSTPEGDEVILDFAKFYKADEMFSWKNVQLMDALQCPDISSYFVPPSMRTEKWFVLLKSLGMKDDLDAKSIIRVAKDIEASSSTLKEEHSEVRIQDEDKNHGMFSSKSPVERGRALLRYLRDDDRAYIFDASLCRTLKSIRFVPAEVPTEVESGGFVVMMPPDVVSFDKMMGSSKGHLGFTLLPTLEADIAPPQASFSSLGIVAVPPLQIVLRHLRNILQAASKSGDTLDRWNMDKKYSIKETFQEIFSFLSDHWRDINLPVRQALSEGAIVPIGSTLVKPARLFFRLSEDLSPFMHEIPRFFGAHEAFLKTLGVREKPSPEDYSAFLTELSVECGGSSLNPNELRAILAIIQAIAQEDSVMERLGAALYVPDESSVLRKSTACLFNNDCWLRERLPSSIESAKHSLFILHPDISRSIALQLNIPLLSDILMEKLCTNFSLLPSPLHASYMSMFEKALLSKSFASAVVQARDRGKGDAQQNDSMEVVHEKLMKLRVLFAQRIKTVLEINDPRFKMTGSAFTMEPANSACFVGEGLSSWDIAVNVEMILPVDKEGVESTKGLLRPSVALSIGLVRALDLDITLSATIALLLDELSSNFSHDVQELLSHLRIGSDPASLRERSRGAPGSELCETDLQMLELKPFRKYRVGEIVAFDSKVNQKGSSDLSTSCCMLYGRVVAVEGGSEAEETGAGVLNETSSYLGMQKISVRIDRSGAVAAFLPTDLYSFKSARDTTSSSSKRQVHSGSASPVLGTVSCSQAPASVSGNKAAASVGMKKDNADSLISKEEVVSAVSGLLHRAGLPITIEKEGMIARVLELENEKRTMEKALETERLAVEETKNAIDQMKAQIRCQICLTSNISHVLSPCGHTVCGDCLVQLQRNQCPFCRKAIERRVKFFLASDDQS